MRIGVAGTGKMGAAIAQRLHELGHGVVVWNRTSEKTTPLATFGMGVAATPEALAAGSDVVIVMLTDAHAQDVVYGGEGGLVQAPLRGKTVIDMSTVRPGDMQRAAAQVRAAGGGFVEAPVGGTVGPARQGKLFGLVGGEASDVAGVRPLLDQLCRRVEHLGPVGSGSAMKLAINLPLVVAYQALGEAYSLCEGLGLDAGQVMELFSDTSGAPAMLKLRGPIIAEGIVAGKFAPPAFDVDSIRKDLRTMVAEAHGRGARLPVAERTLQVFDEAALDGWGSRDGTALPAYWVGKGKSGV